MTIRKSAYDTTACEGYVYKSMQERLDILSSDLFDTSTEGVIVLQSSEPVTNHIASFLYPIPTYSFDEPKVYVDARGLGTWDHLQERFKVRYPLEYEAKMLQGALAQNWISGKQTNLKHCSSIPLAVFAGWVGETIAKRFSVDHNTQFKVSVLAACLYINSFWDKTELTDEDKLEMVSLITRQCGYKGGDISDIVSEYGVILDTADFCKACYSATNSVRLKELNNETLYAMLGGSWWGANGRELVQVALEYPPIWMAIVYQCIVDRGAQKSRIGTIVQRNTYKRGHEAFVREMMTLIT